MKCPVCGEYAQEAHSIDGGTSINWKSIYYGPSRVCVSKEKTRIYGHGEPV